jgi:hypothetical protein
LKNLRKRQKNADSEKLRFDPAVEQEGRQFKKLNKVLLSFVPSQYTMGKEDRA